MRVLGMALRPRLTVRLAAEGILREERRSSDSTHEESVRAEPAEALRERDPPLARALPYKTGVLDPFAGGAVFSPDGRYLAVPSSQGVAVIDLSDDHAYRPIPVPADLLGAYARAFPATKAFHGAIRLARVP